jgi:molybdopterin molybdotransferase
MANLISVDATLQQLLSAPEQSKTVEKVPLLEALGRVTAQPLVSTLDVPIRDNSAMDGYALRLEDIDEANQLPVTLRIPAGTAPGALEPQCAARIFTGAYIPEGADTVVQQEHVDVNNDHITITRRPELGANIRRQGEDIQHGGVIIPSGTRLRPQDIGMAASVGIAAMTVYRKLSVAVFFTGDELVEPGQELPEGKLYNSNHYTIVHLLRGLGVEVIDFGNVPDTLEDTKTVLLKAAAAADVVITTGGVSVGEEDHVRAAVTELGELDLWRIAMKPGKPLAFGTVNDAYFLGLPGNPVSAFVTFLIFARPFLLQQQGVEGHQDPQFEMIAGFDRTKPSPRREYIRVRVSINAEGQQVLQSFPNQSSGVLSSMQYADGLAIIPENTTIASGDVLQFLPFSGMLS